MVRVRASRGTRHGGWSMVGGGSGRHPRTQLARLEAPQQFFVGATQTFLLVALFLHVHLQVGVLLRELPGGEKAQKSNCLQFGHHTQPHTHYLGQFEVSNQDDVDAFGLWLETKWRSRNPKRTRGWTWFLISADQGAHLTWKQRYSCRFVS